MAFGLLPASCALACTTRATVASSASRTARAVVGRRPREARRAGGHSSRRRQREPPPPSSASESSTPHLLEPREIGAEMIFRYDCSSRGILYSYGAER